MREAYGSQAVNSAAQDDKPLRATAREQRKIEVTSRRRFSANVERTGSWRRSKDEVDRSGRRYADASAECTPGPAPEGGYSGFAVEAGDCPNPQRGRVHLQFQGDGRRGPQDYSDLPEIWREQRGCHFEGGARFSA